MSEQQANFDLVAAAEARRAEIKLQRTALDVEDSELESFLRTAKTLAARLQPNSVARVRHRERVFQKATKADVIAAARTLLRKKNPIRTGDVTAHMISEGFLFGGESSPSSVVSAYLSQAQELTRDASGTGWIAKTPEWIEKEIDKLM